MFLSISSYYTSQLKLFLLCFLLTLELTHKMTEFGSLFQLFSLGRMLSIFYFSTPQGRMAFASFFSFSSACPTRFATLLNKRIQTMLFVSPNFLSSFSMLNMLQSSLCLDSRFINHVCVLFFFFFFFVFTRFWRSAATV